MISYPQLNVKAYFYVYIWIVLYSIEFKNYNKYQYYSHFFYQIYQNNNIIANPDKLYIFLNQIKN